MRPDKGVGIDAVGGVGAGGLRAPGIGVHARALQVGLVEQIADVVRNADEVIPVGQAVDQAAE